MIVAVAKLAIPKEKSMVPASSLTVRKLAARRRAQGGFTLIEVIVVVAIIALLAAIIIPVVAGQIAKARETSQHADLKEIANAYNHFFVDNSQWPAYNTGTYTLASGPAPGSADVTLSNNALWVQPPALSTTWKGPYLNTNANSFAAGGVVDRWGHQYHACYSNSGPGTIAIWSLGPDNASQVGTIVTTSNCVCPVSPAGDDICITVTTRLQ